VLEAHILRANENPQFYFVEILHPGHISLEGGVEFEKNKYREEIKSPSTQLIDIAQFIKANKPKAIILIVTDPGGFLGYTYRGAAYKLLEESSSLKERIFSTLYPIKAPKYFEPYR
jgi:hypothetical protein